MANKNTMRNRVWRDGYKQKRGHKVDTSKKGGKEKK